MPQGIGVLCDFWLFNPPVQFLLLLPFFFLKILFIYLTERQPAREGTQQGSGRGRSRLPVEEPDVGLNPEMPGSRPEPKSDA